MGPNKLYRFLLNLKILKIAGGGKGTGTACLVKGSYCQCHYCKCEKGQVHCSGYGKGGGGYGNNLLLRYSIIYFNWIIKTSGIKLPQAF